MTLSELQTKLKDLTTGQAATLNYEMFEILFPPGVEDDNAKQAAYNLAKANGCVIDHQAGQREVRFVKQ